MTAEAASALDESKTVRAEFREVVNMSAAELEKWLATSESKAAGFKAEGEDESVGHASGRRIIELLGKRARDLNRQDIDHMRKVVGYVHRHLAQRPADVKNSRWRHSLMNWGHDPMRDGPAPS